jgi:hypothetical protein
MRHKALAHTADDQSRKIEQLDVAQRPSISAIRMMRAGA